MSAPSDDSSASAPPVSPDGFTTGRSVAVFLLGLVGIVTIVISTFLPWVRSGRVDRSLYQITGVAHRLGFIEALPGTLLPYLAPVCALPVIAALLGLHRTALIIAGIMGAVAAVAGGVAATLALTSRGELIRLVPHGPISCTVGAVLLLVSVFLATRRRSRPSTIGK